MKHEIKLKSNLAKEIVETLYHSGKVELEGYFSIGDKILASAGLEGIATSALCKTIARVIGNQVTSGKLPRRVSEGTLRNCVQLAVTFKDLRLRESLYKSGACFTNAMDLAHSKYEGRRGSILADINAGKKPWDRVTSPARANEKKRQQKIREDIREQAGFDPSEIRIKILEDGEINEDAIEDGLATIITRTSVELASKLFDRATRRIKRL